MLENKEERMQLSLQGGRRFFTVGGAPLWYSKVSLQRTITEAYPLIFAVSILLPSRYSELPASQT